MPRRKDRPVRHSYHYEGNYPEASIRRTDCRNLLEAGPLPFYPFTVEETRRSNRFLFREEFCRYMIISLVLDGKLLYKHDGRNFLLAPGMVLVIPAGTSYSFDTFTTGGYRKLVVELAGPHLDSICTTLGFDRMMMFCPEDTAPLLATIRQLEELLGQQARATMPDLLAAGYKLLLQLAGELRGSRKNSPLLAQAQQKLESALDRPLAMVQVAAELGMSLTNLNRIFRQELHTSPLKYRNTCRIELARELLQHSTLSIKEIAAKAGYCNQFYFTQEFRRCTAQTPTEFRREYRAAVPQSIHQ